MTIAKVLFRFLLSCLMAIIWISPSISLAETDRPTFFYEGDVIEVFPNGLKEPLERHEPPDTNSHFNSHQEIFRRLLPDRIGVERFLREERERKEHQERQERAANVARRREEERRQQLERERAAQEEALQRERESYSFIAPAGEFLDRNRELYSELFHAETESSQQQQVREVGLASVQVADQEYANGSPEAEIFHTLGRRIADVVLGLTPYVGVVKDVTEAVSGFNIVTGEVLTTTDKAFLIVGIAAAIGTAGVISSGAVKLSSRVVVKLAKRMDAIALTRGVKSFLAGSLRQAGRMALRAKSASRGLYSEFMGIPQGLIRVFYYTKKIGRTDAAIRRAIRYSGKLGLSRSEEILELEKYIAKNADNLPRVKEIVGKGYKKVSASRLESALRNFKEETIAVGNQSVRLTKERMGHFLERHHPDYWNGTFQKSQSFFENRPSLVQIKETVAKIVNKYPEKFLDQKGLLKKKGVIKNAEIDGVLYQLKVAQGRFVQFYAR